MTMLTLEYPKDETRTLVKAAFENTQGIKQYNDNGLRVVGKTGMGLGSYGEQVTVVIPEDQKSDNETSLSITSEKEVSMNVTANPEKYESRFFQQLERLRGRDIESVLDEMNETMDPNQSKEVSNPADLRDGTSSMGVVMVIVMVMSLLFMFMMMSAIMP